MLQPYLEPEQQQCTCGRDLADAAAFSHQCGSGRYVYRRCMCGAEWTERLGQYDASLPITWDDLLEVHESLAQFRGTLVDLLGSIKPQPAT